MLTRILPGLFVLIWATGFIVAGIVAGRADPLTFLTARHACSIVVFAGLTIAAGAAFPRGLKAWRDGMVAGILLHGLYVGGVFWAVAHGLPAGLTGLVTGLQPLLTAMLAMPLLGERLGPRQWVGIAIGIVGIGLIVMPKVGSVEGVPLAALCAAFVATASFTLGTIWQKWSKPQVDLRANATTQYVGALAITAPIAFFTEAHHFDASPQLFGALAWAVLGLSVGGIAIMLTLLKHGAASKVAPLLYLAPPVAGLMAWGLFGEALMPIQLFGIVLAVAGAFASRH